MILLGSVPSHSATPRAGSSRVLLWPGAYSVVKVLVPGRGPMVGRLRVQGVVALKLGGSGHLARLEISRTKLPG
jgi:hypothetical protein